MAKYTDPNTGVKYSTHTGLKVFTVIVVILLVISIVLNVVFYMQRLDDSVIDSGENGEGGDDGVVNGDSSDDDTSLEPGEDIVDTETIIENESAALTSDFREHGAATCLYYYPDEHWEGDTWYAGCSYCEGSCEGHEMWITKGGEVYDWPYYEEPDVRTQVLEAEDGSTDINSKVRASLIFTGYPEDEDGYSEYAKYTDYYYDRMPRYIEIVSLTGEPLEIESIEAKQYLYYEQTASGWTVTTKGYRSESGVSVELYDVFTDYDRSIGKCPDSTSVYGRRGGEYGEVTVSLTLSDGNTYSFKYWSISDPDGMLGVELEDVD